MAGLHSFGACWCKMRWETRTTGELKKLRIHTQGRSFRVLLIKFHNKIS